MSAMEKAQTADPGMLRRHKRIDVKSVFLAPPGGAFLLPDRHGNSPVHLGGEHTHDGGGPVDVDDVGDGLEHVKVEERLPRDRAIQPGLHERRPVLLQHPL